MKKKIIIILSIVLILVIGTLTTIFLLQDKVDAPLNLIQKKDNVIPPHDPLVILDAGHGFGDVGCGGPDTSLMAYEKDLNIEMVNTLKVYLEKNGVKVLLTHNGESFPSYDEIIKYCEKTKTSYDKSKESFLDDDIYSPYERCLYANCLAKENYVDFFLSIHVNANPNSEKSKGFELDYCKDVENAELSRAICNRIRNKLTDKYIGRELRYYKDSWNDAFVVTKFTEMPSALFETAFYTNEDDLKLILDKSWRDELMKNIADAISKYLIEK